MMIVRPMIARLMMVVRLSGHPLIQDSLNSSSGKVAEKVPVKLGSPMFRYLVTSFKCRPKGVSSSG